MVFLENVHPALHPRTIELVFFFGRSEALRHRNNLKRSPALPRQLPYVPSLRLHLVDIAVMHAVASCEDRSKLKQAVPGLTPSRQGMLSATRRSCRCPSGFGAYLGILAAHCPYPTWVLWRTHFTVASSEISFTWHRACTAHLGKIALKHRLHRNSSTMWFFHAAEVWDRYPLTQLGLVGREETTRLHSRSRAFLRTVGVPARISTSQPACPDTMCAAGSPL
jgi:hypothetical protein